MVANFSGSALFTLQEALFDRQIIKMKFSYSPSSYRQYHPYLLGESHAESFVLDNNGHTYWLSLPLKEVFTKSKIPDWLCFFSPCWCYHQHELLLPLQRCGTAHYL